MDKRHWEHGPCPKHDCRKDSCKCGLRLISFPAALGDDSKGSPVAPKNGDYCNALVKYESNGHMYVYSTEGVPERLSSNGTLNFEELLNRPQYNGEVMTGETDIPEVPSAVSQLTNDLNFQTRGEVNSTVASAVATETTARQNADNNLQSQIDGISASSDVKDVVGTYAELQAYDTSTLGNNDIIKVLQDEAHSDETTYYRWSTTTQTFTLIGEEGPYYTKAATNTLLAGKQDELTAGTNITIVGDVISASGGPTVVQTPGVSTTSVMSQKAVTKMVYEVFGDDSSSFVSGAIQIDPTYAGAPSQVTDEDSGDVIMIGRGALPTGSGCNRSIQIGAESQSEVHGTALGFKATDDGGEGVALGAFSETGAPNVVSVGNSSATTYVDIDGRTVTVPAFTRRIMNVGTPTSANDAATKGYVDTAVAGADGKADVATSNIGDLTNLTTTAKNTLVASVNEVNSLVSALASKFNLSTHLQYSFNDVTYVEGTGSKNSGTDPVIFIDKNADGSVFKVYGTMLFTPTSTNVKLRIPNTGILTDASYIIEGAGINYPNNYETMSIQNVSLTVNNNSIDITLQNLMAGRLNVTRMFANLYFNSDFGNILPSNS